MNLRNKNNTLVTWEIINNFDLLIGCLINLVETELEYELVMNFIKICIQNYEKNSNLENRNNF